VHLKGSNIQHHGFADKLKDICHQLYGWAGLQDREYYETPDTYRLKDEILPALGKSPRRIWIEFATLVAREVYPYTWVDYLQQTVVADIVIIRDLRFPNEADRIHDHGGYVFKIERPGIVHTPDIADDPLEDYEKWDAVLQNNATLADFHKLIFTLGEKLRLQLHYEPTKSPRFTL
jgi:hypothetical protein